MKVDSKEKYDRVQRLRRQRAEAKVSPAVPRIGEGLQPNHRARRVDIHKMFPVTGGVLSKIKF